MIDMTNLDQYIVIPTTSESLTSIEDLRELEGDFEHGVYPLWSDERQSIVAFAFEPTLFDQSKAEEWIKESKEASEQDQSALAKIGRAIVAAMASFLPTPSSKTPIATRDFEDTRGLVQIALEELYPDAWPWIHNIGPSTCVFQVGIKSYSVDYTIGEDDAVTFGEFSEVTREWVDQDTQMPVQLHAFSVHLADAGDNGEDDGLVWKEIIHPGRWFRSDTGSPVDITFDIIRDAFRAFQDGLPKYVSVPADDHHHETYGIVPAEKNHGFVRKLKMVGSKLFGGFAFTNKQTGESVDAGDIADVSVYLQPDVIHPKTGKRYSWVLRHVLLTNNPLVQDLAPFGAVLASEGASGKVNIQYHIQKKEEQMSETVEDGAIQLSAEDMTAFRAFQELNVTASDVQGMIADRQAVASKARELEITSVVKALEGTAEHDGVVQVEGHRHYPVVCAAVETALREQPQALALAADGNGQTTLDAVVLSIVNAIPTEGRIALQEQPKGAKEINVEDVGASDTDNPPEYTEEQIGALADTLDGGHAAVMSVN